MSYVLRCVSYGELYWLDKDDDPDLVLGECESVERFGLLMSVEDLQVGSRWVHSKSGGVYVLLGLATLERTLEQCVVYRRADGGETWIRPVTEFTDGRFTRDEATK